MQQISDLISKIFETILNFIPRFIIIRDYEGGVAFVFGKARELKSGSIYWYWPLITEIELFAKNTQTVNLPPQVLFLKDKKSYVVEGVICYSYRQCRPAILELFNPDDSIRDYSQMAIQEFLREKDFDSITAMTPKDISEAICDKVKKKVDGLYLNIQYASLTSFAPVIPLRLFGDSNQNIISAKISQS